MIRTPHLESVACIQEERSLPTLTQGTICLSHRSVHPEVLTTLPEAWNFRGPQRMGVVSQG